MLVTQIDLTPAAQQWINLILIWTGFGILVGLLAKALVPGREPAGPVGTLLVGMIGSVVGPLALTLLWRRDPFNPISPLGLLAAIGGVLVLLVVYRVLSPGSSSPSPRTTRERKRKKKISRKKRPTDMAATGNLYGFSEYADLLDFINCSADNVFTGFSGWPRWGDRGKRTDGSGETAGTWYSGGRGVVMTKRAALHVGRRAAVDDERCGVIQALIYCPFGDGAARRGCCCEGPCGPACGPCGAGALHLAVQRVARPAVLRVARPAVLRVARPAVLRAARPVVLRAARPVVRCAVQRVVRRAVLPAVRRVVHAVLRAARTVLAAIASATVEFIRCVGCSDCSVGTAIAGAARRTGATGPIHPTATIPATGVGTLSAGAAVRDAADPVPHPPNPVPYGPVMDDAAAANHSSRVAPQPDRMVTQGDPAASTVRMASRPQYSGLNYGAQQSAYRYYPAQGQYQGQGQYPAQGQYQGQAQYQGQNQ